VDLDCHALARGERRHAIDEFVIASGITKGLATS
jgi:hypothetical protein